MQKKFLELKKVSNQIKNDFIKIINEDYSENEWKNDSKKMKQNIKTFEHLKNLLKNKVEMEKHNNNNEEKDSLNIIENYLNQVETDIVPLINKINEKTKYYEYEEENSISEANTSNQYQGQILVQDLQNNQEMLEERRKQLDCIYQTSAQIKDISESMAKQLNEQGAILDNVETNVITAEENAKKAKAEITQANELSKGNRKKMLCLISIVLIVIVVISCILLSLFL